MDFLTKYLICQCTSPECRTLAFPLFQKKPFRTSNQKEAVGKSYASISLCLMNLIVLRGDRKRVISVAMNMLKDGDLPLEKIAKYSGLAFEQVLELEAELQPA